MVIARGHYIMSVASIIRDITDKYLLTPLAEDQRAVGLIKRGPIDHYLAGNFHFLNDDADDVVVGANGFSVLSDN